MRHVAIGISALLFILATQASASSMWCEMPNTEPNSWAEEALTSGGAIFLGRVLSSSQARLQQSEQVQSPKPNSMQELLDIVEAENPTTANNFDHLVWFEVLKTWKAPKRPIVKARVLLGDLAEYRAFEKGATYLVVAREVDELDYWIRYRCYDAIHNRYSDKFEKALGDSAAAE